MSEQLFITGATGLLGSFITQKFVDQGYKVICGKRKTSDLSLCASFKDQVEWRDIDLLDIYSLKEAIREVDMVIHTAALVSFNPKDTQALDEQNRIGTRNIVDVCLENKIPRFFYTSSVAALGRVYNKKQIDEESKWEESAINSAYAVSKHLAELEVWRGMEEGLQVCIINPSVVLGPGDLTKSSTQLFNMVKKMKGIYPVGRVSLVDVRDVADITFQLVQKGVSGEKFIVNATSISFKELFSEIAKKLGVKGPTICFTKRKAIVLYPFFQLLAFLTRKPSYITRESIKLMDEEFEYDASKVKDELTFQFRGWKESVEWTCETLTKR